jgi:uncharacterized protein (DUF488 family)
LPFIYTLGYFGLEWTTFVSLLTRYGIEDILDVRVSPISPFLPCFSRTGLERDLPLWGRRYHVMGPELGGRRCGAGIADAVSLARGLDKVMALWRQGRCLTLFCIEEDPRRCHRGTRLAPALVALGARVVHIRGDGTLEAHPGPPGDEPERPPREEPR